MDTLEDRIADTVHVPELSSPSKVKLSQYSGEDELPEVMRLIEKNSLNLIMCIPIATLCTNGT